jgi:hypothetical protein
MSEFQTNFLPFSIINPEVEISFSAVEKKGYRRIYKKNLPKKVLQEFQNRPANHAWWSLHSEEGDFNVLVNLFESSRFAKHYLNKILYDHFQNQALLINSNFINDTEIYVEDKSARSNDYKKFKEFSLRIDTNDLRDGPSLLVYYEGVSYILNRSAEAAKLDSSLLGRVKYEGRIEKFEKLSEDQQRARENIYPILSQDIRRILNLEIPRNFSENKYKKFYEEINEFYELHLKDKTIGGNIKIYETGFYKPYEAKIKHTSDDSNLLLFGNNQQNFVPYNGLKENGPLQGLISDETIKFIFIFHKDDKDFANKVYSYLRKGYKSFPGLESFIKLNFDIDTEKTIRFSSNNPIAEIKSALEKLEFDAETTYSALYISRIKRDTDNEEEDEVYYKLKELLLHYRMTSQVIFKNNIDNPSFNFFLPNIAVALLAKLGGVPWRLYRPIKNDLVVGVGAYRSRTSRTTYIGSAFCFRNDGSFKSFNAFQKNDTEGLANSIQDSINEYIEENKGVERLVIHYYKQMSQEEAEPIQAVLDNLNLSVPRIVVTATESYDYLLFDTKFDGKMPQSGTYINTKGNEFILCNNTRYSKNTGTKIDGFPLPIKVKIQSSNYEKLDEAIVLELIDQVYQFSRMYWKSVRQRSMPVTIEYSEIVAEMIAHFDKKELEPFARNSLWFL